RVQQLCPRQAGIDVIRSRRYDGIEVLQSGFDLTILEIDYATLVAILGISGREVAGACQVRKGTVKLPCGCVGHAPTPEPGSVGRGIRHRLPTRRGGGTGGRLGCFRGRGEPRKIEVKQWAAIVGEIQPVLTVSHINAMREEEIVTEYHVRKAPAQTSIDI